MRFVRRLGRSARTALPPHGMRAGRRGPGRFRQRGPGRRRATASRRKTHVFRIVLSHSRKGYSEAVFRQNTENFIRCLENAFHHFGGSVKTLVIDNLRAAVTKADWYEPELHPKLRSFCEHYGVVILPTRPYMPRHKGKIESGREVRQAECPEGPPIREPGRGERIPAALGDDHRRHADSRHDQAAGGQAVREVERAALSPLPLERFPFFHERQHTVHRDGHVQVDGAYYSVPPEYSRQRRSGCVGTAGWCGSSTSSWRRSAFTSSSRRRGVSAPIPADIAPEKISGVERGAEWLLRRASAIGEHADRWAQEVIRSRGIEGIRAVIGLLEPGGPPALPVDRQGLRDRHQLRGLSPEECPPFDRPEGRQTGADGIHAGTPHDPQHGGLWGAGTESVPSATAAELGGGRCIGIPGSDEPSRKEPH